MSRSSKDTAKPLPKARGVLRIEAGTEFREPVSHEFFEEAYYLQGEMLNTKTKETTKAGSYVFHEPHEEHGPFKCIKTTLILEFRYYKQATSE